MRHVADSFTWPFRGKRYGLWLGGAVAVLLTPLLTIPLLGYAVEATRASELDPAAEPPRFRLTSRLLVDGSWMVLALLIVAAPFALLLGPLAHSINSPFAYVFAILILALPWGFVMLLLVPGATARFAASGNPRDLFDPVAALHAVRRDFATWNVVVAAIVTAWAIGIACVGLLCVGLVPGVFYAILVSAHATAALRPSSTQTSRQGTH